MCFVWLSERTGITPLYSIVGLVFIWYNREALFTARVDWIFQYTSSYIQCSRPCPGSDRSSPASHQGCSRSGVGRSMCDLRWTKWQWDRLSSRVPVFSPVSINIIILILHTHTHSSLTTTCPYQKDKGTNPSEPWKISAVSEIGEHWLEKYFLVSSLVDLRQYLVYMRAPWK